jgi:hypothetical protein
VGAGRPVRTRGPGWALPDGREARSSAAGVIRGRI